MNPESRYARGWILYDGRCPICRAGARRLLCVGASRGYRVRPLQMRWVQEVIDRQPEPVGDEILLLLPDGRILGGVDVLTHIGFRTWWGWPLAALASLPGVNLLCRKLYAWIAANRYRFKRGCSSGQCKVGH